MTLEAVKLQTDAELDREDILNIISKAQEIAETEKCEDVCIILTRRDGMSYNLKTEWGTKTMLAELELVKAGVLKNLLSRCEGYGI